MEQDAVRLPSVNVILPRRRLHWLEAHAKEGTPPYEECATCWYLELIYEVVLVRELETLSQSYSTIDGVAQDHGPQLQAPRTHRAPASVHQQTVMAGLDLVSESE